MRVTMRLRGRVGTYVGQTGPQRLLPRRMAVTVTVGVGPLFFQGAVPCRVRFFGGFSCG